jgi:uncharacterized protein YdhG (YjbR/CyaY superfamily)
LTSTRRDGLKVASETPAAVEVSLRWKGHTAMAKLKPSRHAPEEIDAYLEALPDDIRSSLERVRRIVRETAPQTAERVSYKIPIFRLGKDLVGMSAQKDHCALHTMSPLLMKAMDTELKAKGVKVSGATIHFTPEDPLPEELAEQIVRARMEEVGYGTAN